MSEIVSFECCDEEKDMYLCGTPGNMSGKYVSENVAVELGVMLRTIINKVRGQYRFDYASCEVFEAAALLKKHFGPSGG